MLAQKEAWRPWYANHGARAPAGYVTTYTPKAAKDFSFLTVRLAGEVGGGRGRLEGGGKGGWELCVRAFLVPHRTARRWVEGKVGGGGGGRTWRPKHQFQLYLLGSSSLACLLRVEFPCCIAALARRLRHRGSRTPGAPARDQFYIPILSCTLMSTNPPCTRRTHPPSLIRAAGSAAHTPRPNRMLACAPAQVTWCPRTSPRLHSLS